MDRRNLSLVLATAVRLVQSKSIAVVEPAVLHKLKSLIERSSSSRDLSANVGSPHNVSRSWIVFDKGQLRVYYILY